MKKTFFILILTMLWVVSTSLSTSFAAGLEGIRNDVVMSDGKVVACHDAISDSLRGRSTFDAEIYFRLDKGELDKTYLGNDVTFDRLYKEVQAIGWDRIDSIEIVSYASPEGTYERNMWLSNRRSQEMQRFIDEEYPQLSSLLTIHDGGESWALLHKLVADDAKLDAGAKEQILAVIDADVDTEVKKQQMKKLAHYEYLLATYYPVIRKSMLCVVYFRESRISSCLLAAPARLSEPAVVEVVPADVIIPEPVWTSHLYLKTNVAAWGMGISNVAVEADVAPHWSVALPLYYSAWNYFKQTNKFRTFAIQPEARYWLSRDNVGFFAGLHLNMAYYNFALGEIRYQDHDGCSPAWGGGVNIGYRLPISSNQRWHLEFNVGAGVHSLYYDTFYNTPDTKDGLLIDTHRDTYWGIDQVGITFSYRFDMCKKGGKR